MSFGTKVLLITFPILFILFLIFISINLIAKQRNLIKHNKVFEVIKNSLGNKIINMYFKSNDMYDLFIETQYSKYYIRILTDTKNKILKVDSNYNYYFADKNKNYKLINDSVKICSNEFSHIDVNKRVNKIIILYPDVVQKIYLKSDVEVRFIYSDFEIQGVHILNFSEVKDFFDESEL